MRSQAFIKHHYDPYDGVKSDAYVSVEIRSSKSSEVVNDYKVFFRIQARSGLGPFDHF